MNILGFLEVRIAEDEELARSVLATVAPDKWENPTSWGNFFPEDIAFWDSQTPYRVLAECAAKRAIIAEHEPVDPCDAHDAEFKTITCDTIRALATVYADHADYRQEWAPRG